MKNPIYQLIYPLNKNLDYVKSETLSNIIQFNVESSGVIDIIFDKLKTKIFITKV